MMRHFIMLLVLAALTTTVSAQDWLQEVNDIKSNTDYLHAMGTSTVSGDEATDNACQLLEMEIEQWLEENGVTFPEGCIERLCEKFSPIKAKQGKLSRVFVFIKKADVMQFVEGIKSSPAPPPPYQPTIRERLMLNVATFNELNDYVNAGREDGSIVDVGKYSNMPQQGLVYAFIHNRNGEIPACMKVSDGKTLNLRTGREDRIADYKGCGAIWIKFNEE